MTQNLMTALGRICSNDHQHVLRAISSLSLLITYKILLICMLGSGLQITVGHQTLANQNLLMSDEIPTMVGHEFYGKDE